MQAYNWFSSIYFRPKNNCLPELIQPSGKRTPLIEIGKTEDLMLLIKESFLNNEERPIIVYNGTHYIEHLDKLFISPRHRKILEENEIAFYFFEPLTHYKIRPGFDPSLEPHILRIDNEPYELDLIRCLELESIDSWAKQNNLKNVKVYCTDHKSNLYYQKFYPNIQLLETDLWVSWWCKRFSWLTKRGNGGSWYHPIDPSLITKKFWSGAWRYDASRHFITAYLAGKDMIKDNNVSFYFKISNEEMKRRFWFGWKEFTFRHADVAHVLETGNTKLQELVPLSIDIDETVALGEDATDPEFDSDGFNLRKSHDPYNTYYECFCAIVQESRVTQPWPNISEKTLNAIKNYRPFVMSGAPGTLKMLKEMGFKTFDKYWPEDYDEIISNKDRLAAVCKTIDYINTFTIDELKEMYNDMIPILIHNCENIERVPEWYDNINAEFIQSSLEITS